MVVDYDPDWPATFKSLATRVAAALGEFARRIEHVGSTAVPGLAAKPIIDMTVVVDPADVGAVIERLAQIGYVHRGNLGIAEREAFRQPPDLPRHHLYLCPDGALALRNHIAVRDRLRTDPEARATYDRLKRDLAARFPDDIDGYIEGKTEFLLQILSAAGLASDKLEEVERANRRQTPAEPGADVRGAE